MNHTKKLLAFLLSFVMILTMLSMPIALAVEDIEETQTETTEEIIEDDTVETAIGAFVSGLVGGSILINNISTFVGMLSGVAFIEVLIAFVEGIINAVNSDGIDEAVTA